MSEGIWPRLGIAPTRDMRAIRSAYAARLKSIDPDQDRDAFLLLRQAFDDALALARQAEEAMAGDGDVGFRPLDQPADDGDAEPSPHDSEYAGSWSRGERIFQEMAAILADPDRRDADLDMSEQARIDALTHQFSVWLGSVPIDHARDCEWSFARLLAETTPRSDSILDAASALFGWNSASGQWDTPPPVQHLLARRDGNRAYAALARPDHRYHKAFLALTAAEPLPFWQRPPKQDVRTLIDAAAAQHPSIYAAFNPARIAEWEGRQAGDGASNGWWIFGAILLFSLLRMVMSATPQPEANRYMPPPVMTQTGLDIQQALGPDLPLGSLRRQNPAFVAELEDVRQKASARNSNQMFFAARVQLALDREYHALISRADPALLRSHWQSWLDKMDWVRTHRAKDCVDYALGRSFSAHRSFGTDEPIFSDAIVDRDMALRAKLLTTVPRSDEMLTRRDGKTTTAVAGRFIDAVIKQTRLPRAQVIAAFGLDRKDDTVCMVRMTLIRVLLADKSAEALALLRKL